MPILMCAGMWLFMRDMAPIYWLFALPIIPLAAFMTTLAAVHDDGGPIFVKQWWAAPKRIPRTDVLSNGESVHGGIGKLRLRRFVLPWGGIYFVHEWSVTSKEKEISKVWKTE